MFRKHELPASAAADLSELSHNFRQTRRGAPAYTDHMASHPRESNALSVPRTFVVQLHVGAMNGRYSGRVEHVASGRALQFTTLETLLKFMECNGAESSATADSAPP
jgi:hypothetical protein